MKQTQRKWVEAKLRKDGRIRRNESIANYIQRLGAIIHKLKQQGWEFSAGYIPYKTLFQDGKDYEYIVIKEPEPHE